VFFEAQMHLSKHLRASEVVSTEETGG